MQLLILAALILYILPDHVLVPMLSYRAGKISVRPELPTPQLLFDLRTPFENLPCSQTLDDCHNLRHAIRWNRLHQKMNMVIVRSYLQKFYLMPLLNL